MRTSIGRRIGFATTAAVSLVIAGTGLMVHRTVDRQLATAGREGLEALLRTGHLRTASDAKRAERAGDYLLSPPSSVRAEGYEWLVRRPEPLLVLAGTLDFPRLAERAALPRPSSSDGPIGPVAFGEFRDDQGELWRAASLWFQPAESGQGADGRRPRSDGNQGDGPRGDGPRGDAPRGDAPRGDAPRGDAPWGDGPGGSDGRRRRGPLEDFRQEDRFEVFVATNITRDERELAALARALAVAGLLAVASCGLLIRVFVRAGLRPLDELSRRVEVLDLAGDELTLPSAPIELVPIVTALDATRARLGAAFERERRFTSDAAHELRTPLAGLRATLEVALSSKRSPAEVRAAASESLGIALSMQETVESLLWLARRGTEREGLVPIDLGASVRAAFECEDDLDPRFALTEGTVVLGLPQLLDRVVDNAIRNVRAYALPGTTVEVQSSTVAERVRLEVSNACAPLPAETADRAFDAFWRADAARTGDGAQVGLGLALVRQCMEAMNGTAEVVPSASGGRFTLRLEWPAAPPTP